MKRILMKKLVKGHFLHFEFRKAHCKFFPIRSYRDRFISKYKAIFLFILKKRVFTEKSKGLSFVIN